MKLFTEIVEDVQYVVEEKNGKKDLYITGIYMQAETKNGNGRVYKLPILALGELGHPSGPSINLDRVSHKIVELKQDGNNFIGKAKVLSTPMGNIAKNLLESGVQLGVSTRGMGSLKEVNGVMEVQEDFYLATAADIVADPSAPDAFVQGIMEGVEWVWDNGILHQKQVESYKRVIEKASQKELESTSINVWEHFVKSLSNK
jgi:hypothetical protein